MKFSAVIATSAMIFGSALADGYEYNAPVVKTTTPCTKGAKPTYAPTYGNVKPTYHTTAAGYAAPEVTYTSHAYYTVGSHVYSSPVYSVSTCTKGTYGTPAGYSAPSSAPYYAPPSNYSSPYGTPNGYEAPSYQTTPCTKNSYATPAPVYSAPVYGTTIVTSCTTTTTPCTTPYAAPYTHAGYAPSYSAPAPVYTAPAPVYNSSTPTYAPAYTGSGASNTISYGVAAIAAVAAIFIAA